MPRRKTNNAVSAGRNEPRWLVLVTQGARLDLISAHGKESDAQMVYALLNRLAGTGISAHLMEVPRQEGLVSSPDPIAAAANAAPRVEQVQRVALEAANLMQQELKPNVQECSRELASTGRDEEAFS